MLLFVSAEFGIAESVFVAPDILLFVNVCVRDRSTSVLVAAAASLYFSELAVVVLFQKSPEARHGRIGTGCKIQSRGACRVDEGLLRACRIRRRCRFIDNIGADVDRWVSAYTISVRQGYFIACAGNGPVDGCI